MNFLINRAHEFLQHIDYHSPCCSMSQRGGQVYLCYQISKAALNQSLNWSEIDQQLWLMVFTVHSATLKEEYPLFNNGPQHYASLGAKQGGNWQDFSRTGACRQNNVTAVTGNILEIPVQVINRPECTQQKKRFAAIASPTKLNANNVVNSLSHNAPICALRLARGLAAMRPEMTP